MSNPFDDYINKLEGQTEVDPLTIVRDLRGIHTQELSTREAKIQELNGAIAEKDSAITEGEKELLRQKARNFDLISDIPNPNDVKNANKVDEPGKPDAATIKIADLFKPNVRNRHGL